MTESLEMLEAWAGLRAVGVPWGAHLLANVAGFQEYCTVNESLDFAFVAQSSSKPQTYTAIESIKITSTVLSDGVTWHTVFELQNRDYEAEFSELCADLTRAVLNADSAAEAQKVFHAAYEDWVTFFGKKRGFTLEGARGLFAEITYLLSELTPVFDWEQSLDSWHGPLGGVHDFVLPNNVAVEIKSIQPSGNTIIISSENQLYFEGTLFLRLYRVLDFVSGSVGVTLEALVNQAESSMSRSTRDTFRSMLKRVSYEPDSVYSKNTLFKVTEVLTFDANAPEFPKITKNMVRPAVSQVKYQLGVPLLSSFKVSEIVY